MSMVDFQNSLKGKLIGDILHAREAVQRMTELSEQGRPALLAVADRIGQVAPGLSKTEKQHVGRWLHRILGPRGWRPVDKKRLPAGSPFTTAAVYRKAMPDHTDGAPDRDSDASREPSEAQKRLLSAREAIKRLPYKPQSVGEFLVEKRRLAKRER